MRVFEIKMRFKVEQDTRNAYKMLIFKRLRRKDTWKHIFLIENEHTS